MSRLKDALPYDVAAAELTDVSVAGYLDKKRPSKKFMSIKYQRRWCMVYGNYFMYYFSPEDKCQKGSFSLAGYKFLASPGYGDYGFSLVSRDKRSFEFIAQNEEDFNRWKIAISKGIDLTKRNIAPITPIKPNPNGLSLLTDAQKHATLPPRSASPSPMATNMNKTTTLPSRSVSPLPSNKAFSKCPPPRPKVLPITHRSGPRGTVTVPGFATPNNVVNDTHMYAKPIKNVDKSPKQPIKQSPKLPPKSDFKHSPKLSSRSIVDDSESTSDSLDLSDDNENEVKLHDTDDDDDDDDDDDGYIRTDKLHCHKRNINYERSEKAKSYTADDYMTVLPDIVPHPVTKLKQKSDDASTSDESDVDRKNLITPDDISNTYMTVLSDNVNHKHANEESPYVDCDALKASKPEKIYCSVETDLSEKNPDCNENHIDDIKTIYHSVKRTPHIGFIHQRSESDYASVDTWGIQLPKKRHSNHYSSSNSEDEDMDDYVDPHDVVDYSTVGEIALPTKVKTPVQSRKAYESEDSCSSYESDTYSSDESTDDYEKVDELKKCDNDKDYKFDGSDKDDAIDHYEKPITNKRCEVNDSQESGLTDPLYANFN